MTKPVNDGILLLHEWYFVEVLLSQPLHANYVPKQDLTYVLACKPADSETVLYPGAFGTQTTEQTLRGFLFDTCPLSTVAVCRITPPRFTGAEDTVMSLAELDKRKEKV